MSNLMTVTVELAPEDRARLDKLIEAFSKVCIPVARSITFSSEGGISATATLPDDSAPTPEKKPDLPVEDPVHLEPPKQEEPPFEVDKPADPEPEAQPVELSEFQKAITTKLAAHPELKPKLKALVNEYARNVSGVPAEKRSEVLRRWAEM